MELVWPMARAGLEKLRLEYGTGMANGRSRAGKTWPEAGMGIANTTYRTGKSSAGAWNWYGQRSVQGWENLAWNIEFVCPTAGKTSPGT